MHVNRLSAVVLGFLSSMSFAQGASLPPSTLLRNLGEATLRINRDILILPNATRVAFKSGAIVSDYSESSFPMCSIEVRKSAPRARILKAGARAIELTGETGNDVCHQGGCWIHLLAYPGDQTIDSVLCAESMDEGQAITLKVLEEAFGNYVTVDTANPDSGLR